MYSFTKYDKKILNRGLLILRTENNVARQYAYNRYTHMILAHWTFNGLATLLLILPSSRGQICNHGLSILWYWENILHGQSESSGMAFDCRPRFSRDAGLNSAVSIVLHKHTMYK